MAEYLLDTGPLVAALCHQDRWHGWARSALPELRGSFLTCDAVATDAAHLLRKLCQQILGVGVFQSDRRERRLCVETRDQRRLGHGHAGLRRDQRPDHLRHE